MRRDKDGVADRLTAVRDVVEIVAIVLAGCWAFYTFVYNDRIKPSESPPTLVVEAKLEPVGAKGSLRAIKLTRTYRNAGSIQFRFLASVESVLGERVTGSRSASLRPQDRSDVQVTFARGVEHATSEVAFALGRRYARAGGSTQNGFTLDPGESSTNETIIYLPRDRYDALLFSGEYRFTTDLTDTIPVSLVKAENGHLETKENDPACATPDSPTCRSTVTTMTTTVSLWP